MSDTPTKNSRVNNRRPINSNFAGKRFEFRSNELSIKYPEGVYFSKEGFPDFSPYAIAEVEAEPDRPLEFDYVKDADRANKAFGMKSTPADYVWHHAENTKSLQLIPKDLHYCLRHTGGVAYNNHLQANLGSEIPLLARDSIIQDSMQIQRGLMADAHVTDLDKSANSAVSSLALATDLARGDYTAAATDGAAFAAETRAGQEMMLSTAARLGAREAFEGVARKLPFVAAALAYSSMQAEAQGFEEAGRPDLAEAARMAGWAEVGGGVFGGFAADYSREAMRTSIIDNNGPQFAEIAKSGTRQILEGAYEAGKSLIVGESPASPVGVPLGTVLPTSYRSLTQGSDEMGERSDVCRVAVDRTGYPAGDIRNSLALLTSARDRPAGHLLVLQDGSVRDLSKAASRLATTRA